MELNAKISSLEEEVKLLKGEVKLILSEIRAAILGQDNPFATESGQRLNADPDALGTRPPIRVVKVPPEGEEEEALSEAEEAAPETPWPEEPHTEARAEAPAVAPQRHEAASAPARPAPSSPESPLKALPAQAPQPPPAARQEPQAAPPQNIPSWNLMTVAGLAVWAEDALKQVGPERLQILLDLCEFAGYLPKAAKEALARVANLGLVVDEETEPASVNECLVILYQLDALMRGEELTGVSQGRTLARR